MSKDFSELVGEALGRASMAWSETPVGIFDSDACCVLHIDIMNAHNEEIKKLQAENAKLRECVEFYVKICHWGIGFVGEMTCTDPVDYKIIVAANVLDNA